MTRLRKFAASFAVTFVVFSPLLFSAPAAADPTSGLNQDVYTYDPSALPDRVTTYTLCNSSVVPNMNFDVGGDVVANCQQDFVLIHWYGYITMPTTGYITFTSLADDGFYMSINDMTVIDNWWLKGCGGGQGTTMFQAGVSQKIDVWWYEYGGGACNYLYYNDSVGNQVLVPDSAFTVDAQAVVDPVPVDPGTTDGGTTSNPSDGGTTTDPTGGTTTPSDPGPADSGQGPDVTPPPSTDKPVPVPVVKPPQVQTPTPPVVVPPVVNEPKTPELLTVDPSTIDPKSLAPSEVKLLQETANTTLATASEDSPEYQKALDQLMVAAQADDIQVDPQLAATPVIGAVAVGVTNAINALGNIGADMSPAHRATAKKEVVAAVVVTNVAVAASGIATQAAASAAGAAGAVRRKP